jgi:hypothetical protein
MYQKPAVEKFGTFRTLTRAGCNPSNADGATFMGVHGGQGDPPRVTNGTVDYCFTGSKGSR